LQDLATLRVYRVERLYQFSRVKILARNLSFGRAGDEDLEPVMRNFAILSGLCRGVEGFLVFAILTVPVGAQQAAKKSAASPAADVCAYRSRSYGAKSYQMHGLTCQECIDGQWVDVGAQECGAHPKTPALKQGKARGHLCGKDDGNYSVGAVFAGADDCSRCTGRVSPNDWDALEKMYFCEKLNPSGDVD
jgi:hypothetical protein